MVICCIVHIPTVSVYEILWFKYPHATYINEAGHLLELQSQDPRLLFGHWCLYEPYIYTTYKLQSS